MQLTYEARRLLALKFEGAPKKQVKVRAVRTLVVTEGSAAGSIEFLNEAQFAGKTAFLQRETLRAAAATYVAQGRTMGEARRLAREDAAASDAPIASYISRGGLKFSPFSTL